MEKTIESKNLKHDSTQKDAGKNILQMKKGISGFLFIIMMLFCGYSFAQEVVCATPGADGVQEFPAPQNSFFPGAGDNITVNAGDTSFILEGIPDPFISGGVLYGFGNNQISKGDLLLIIQIQGATINIENNNRYGSGIGDGSGYLHLNNVGKYEYMVALNNVPATGGELKFRASGTNAGLLHAYDNKPADSNNGVKRFQVIRLMQYSELTLTDDVVTTPWNGRAGGVIAIDVAGTLNFNNKTVNASRTGFRGGYLPARTIEDEQYSDYVTSVYGQNGKGSTKGEGIAGTPRFVWDGFEYFDQGTGWEGYPGGDWKKGAAGIDGGGGNVDNGGGGGGGNGGAGGAGGYGWPLQNETPETNDQNDQESLLTGGRPGVAVPSNVSNGLLFMGGGGGAGDANTSPDGASGGVGGGIVFITANKITGNGYIITNGGNGKPGSLGQSGDGSGGGGAGGSVFVNVKEPSPGANLTIQAKGGNGGHSTTTVLHGPGGGGGGGIIYYNANGASVSTDVSPGDAGRINEGNPVDPSNYDDFPIGANKLQNGSEFGNPGVARSFNPNELPPHLLTSAYCYPELSISKWRDQPMDSVPAGSVITYKIQITNTGGGAKGTRINDVLPAGFQFVLATIDFSLTAGNPQPLNNIGTAENPILGTFDLVTGEGAFIEMQVQVPFDTPEGTYHNGIQVGYLDPTRKIFNSERIIFPPTHSLPGQNTTYEEGTDLVGGSNYHPSQEGEEVIIVQSELGIIKTLNSPCVTPAGNIYSIVLLNSNPYPINGIEVTDIIDAELNIINISGIGWTFTNTGNAYTFKLDELSAGTAQNPYTSEPVYITVEPKSTATKSSWQNTASVHTPKGVINSSVMLYQQPVQATASEITFPGNTCDSGIYYILGNLPSAGEVKWEFVGNSGSAYFENPNQHNTRILGIQPGQTVEVVWTITSLSCGTVTSPPLVFTRSIASSATIQGGGTLCAGAPITSAQNITITLSPQSGRKRIKYLDGGGYERVVVTSTNATSYVFTPNFPGTYTLLEIKAGATSNDPNHASWTAICPGVTSGIAQVNITTQAPLGGIISYHGGPVCKGEVVPMSLVLSGQNGTVLGWQSSTDNNTWSGIIPGTENLTSYAPVINGNIYYRAMVRGGVVGGVPCFPDKESALVYIVTKDCNDVSVSKSIDDITPDAGQTITFTITATNERDANATGVVVFDKLPNGYTYVSHTTTQGNYNQNSGNWTIGNLNAGQSRVLTVTALVNQTGQYTNRAVISCNQQETNYANNTAEITPDVNCDVRNVSPKIN